MIKENFGIEATRFGKIREVTKKAKEAGLPKRDRREEAIKQVGEDSLDFEKPSVKERAIRKYWEYREGSPEMPVAFVVPHSQIPSAIEMTSLLHEKFPERGRDELKNLAEKWKKVFSSREPHKVLPPDHPDYLIYESIQRLENVNEAQTKEIVEEATGQMDQDKRATALISKKSRMFGDPNRPSFFHKPKGIGKKEKGTFIQTKEYPTSVRASWYWAIEKKLKSSVGLDTDGKLLKPFLQIAIHGMKDRKMESGGSAYDVVIGGGNPEKGETGEFVNPEVLNWFFKNMAEKLTRIDGCQDMRVAIDKKGKDKVEVLEAGEKGKVIKKEIQKIGAGLSGAGLGLEYLRHGATYQVENLKGSKRELKLPGFGENFNTIQLEISRKIRKDSVLREAFSKILAELAVDFKRNFK
jgi:hypothetical protein